MKSAKLLQTAGIAASTAIVTSAAMTLVLPDAPPAPSPLPNSETSNLTTTGLFGGTLLAPGMTDRVAMEELGASSGVAGSVTTIERAVLFQREGVQAYDQPLFGYEIAVIGVLDDNGPYAYNYGNVAVHGYPVVEDGVMTKLTIVNNTIDPGEGFSDTQPFTHFLNVQVNGVDVAGPFQIDQCTQTGVIMIDLNDIQVIAGDQLTVSIPPVGILNCDGTPFDCCSTRFKVGGPYIIDISRERTVSPGVPGDVNGDGVVNFGDLVATLFLFTDNPPLTS